MKENENLEQFMGLWCVFPVPHDQFGKNSNDSVRIHRVEEIGVRFGGVPYIRFQAEHNHARVIELLGAWCISNESRYSGF
jgi:hypothetical protein